MEDDDKLVDILSKYDIRDEYQYVDGSIDKVNKIIYLSRPYKPQTLIHELWHVLYPRLDEIETERQSQTHLREHPQTYTFLRNYLKGVDERDQLFLF